MQAPNGEYWVTDSELFAKLPGGPAVIEWFGFVPSFHDGSLERLEVARRSVTIELKTFRMTAEVDAKGYFVLDRHAVVSIHMSAVSGISLVGDAESGIFELGIRQLTIDPPEWETCIGPKAGDHEVCIETTYGLAGSIFAREVRLSLAPLRDPISPV
jgi:hypothetical protein